MLNFIRFTFLATLFLVGFACQNYNSNSADELSLAQIEVVGTDNFKNAFYLLRDRCFSCHAEKFGSLTTEKDWIDSGYVVRGDVVNSKIVKATLPGFSPFQMPPGGAPFGDAEYSVLSAWINSIE